MKSGSRPGAFKPRKKADWGLARYMFGLRCHVYQIGGRFYKPPPFY